MKRLLVTGISGFLGWNLGQQARQSWDVYGTYFSHKVAIPDVKSIKLDVTNLTELKAFFSQFQPDAVIHLAAASKPNFCQNNPQLSSEINVTAAVNIAHLCSELNIPYVFTSTDLVFDGLNSPYKETDPVSPISYYGEQKVKAEQEILRIYPNSVIARMPLMFGLPSPVSASFIQFFLATLKMGEKLNLFTDEFRTPVSGSTAAKGLLLALEKASGGILHLGGKERISRYEFGLLMAEVLGLPKSLIIPGKQSDIPMTAPRSPDTALDSSKAFALGYQPLSLRQELEQLKGKV